MKSIKKDVVYVYSGFFLRYLSLLILIPYYARVLGPESYGKVLAAMSLMGIVWMIINYGFSATGARELASMEDESEYGLIFGRHLLARAMLVPLGVSVGIIGTLLSPALADDKWFGGLACIIGILNAFNLGWFFQGLRQFRTSMSIEVLSYPLNIIFVLLLVKTQDDGIFALIGMLATNAVCTIIAYSIALKKMTKGNIKLSRGWIEIKGASIIFVQSLNSMIMTTGSTYMLSLFSNSKEVGYFGVAERLISFGLALLGPASQILMPTISRLNMLGFDNALPMIRKGILFEVIYGLCVPVCCFLTAAFVVPLIFGKQFEPSILPLIIMACMFPFAAFNHAFGLYVLLPQRQEKWLVLAVSLGNIVSLAFAVWLSPNFGSVGMAISRTFGEIIIALVLAYILFRLGYAKKILMRR